MLNRNIGCIEIMTIVIYYPSGAELNRNIGCIEIFNLEKKPKLFIVEP